MGHAWAVIDWVKLDNIAEIILCLKMGEKIICLYLSNYCARGCVWRGKVLNTVGAVWRKSRHGA